MSAPGWYPDPENPSGYRYWDGSAWTTTRIGSADASSRSSRAPVVWFVVAMVAVTALVAVLVFRPGSANKPISPDTQTAKPQGKQWNELAPSKSPSPSLDPGDGTMKDCPVKLDEDRSELSSDARLHGGGLSIVPPRSFRQSPVYVPALTDHNSMMRAIRPGWVSNVSVGMVLHRDGFTDARGSALQLADCLASSSLFRTLAHREELVSTPFELDGAKGWHYTMRVHVSEPTDVDGDEVNIVILDTGRPDGLSAYVSCATIRREDNLREVAETFKTLRVER